MTDAMLLAQTDALPGGFYVPGSETLPGWVIGIGTLAYVLLLAWNAANNFSNGRKQADRQIEHAEKPAGRLPADMFVTGAALADRQAMTTLGEGMESLSDAIREVLGEKSPALRVISEFTASVVRLSTVYEKRVEIDERDSREAEIRRRVAEELRRQNGGA